jgi:hypothetical protein
MKPVVPIGAGLLLAGIVVWRLSPQQIDVPAVAAVPRAVVLENLTSTFRIPVAVELKELRDFLEHEIPKADEEFSLNLLSGYSLKRGKIEVANQRDRLVVSTRVSGRGIATGLLGAKIDGDFAVSVQPGLDRHWKPKLRIEVDPDIDTAKIVVPLFPDISIRDEVEDRIDDLGQRHALRLSRQFVTRLALKERAEKVWSQAHTTIRINADPPVWLSLAPVSVGMKPLDYRNKTEVRSGLVVSLELGLHLAASPPPVPLRPLPELRLEDNLTDKFEILLPVLLGLPELEKVLEKALAGKKVSVAGGHEVSFGKVTLKESGGRLRIGAEIKAAGTLFRRPVRATLQIEGSPVFDGGRQQLRFENVDFNAVTKEALLATAAWLLDAAIVREIEQRAVLPLPEVLRDLKKAARSELARARLPEWLAAKVVLHTVELRRLAVVEGLLIPILHGTGTAEVSGIRFDYRR